jgi:hypothetical protein
MKTGKLDWLSGFLAEPHPPMPNFNLTRQEIQDLVAYFESFRSKMSSPLARPGFLNRLIHEPVSPDRHFAIAGLSSLRRS